MDEQVDLRKVKDRSPPFPFITLEQALERARQFYSEEKRGVAPLSRAVLHWNYSPSSSGALQTVAALKSYGLMDEPGGSGSTRQLQLSQLALRILLDQRPDSTERMECVRQAALMPPVVAEVYGQWPDQLPTDPTLNHFLVLNKRFAEQNAAKVVKILKQNQIFARIGQETRSSNEQDYDEDEMNDQEHKTPVRGDTTNVGLTPAPQARLQPVKAGTHTEQLMSLDGEVTVTLHFSSKPDAELYEWIGTYVSMKAERLKKVADAAAKPGSSPTP